MSEELVGIAAAFIQGTKEHEKFIKENFTTQQYKALNEIAERIALAHGSGIKKGMDEGYQQALNDIEKEMDNFYEQARELTMGAFSHALDKLRNKNEN